MSKISIDAARAFISGNEFKRDNTRVYKSLNTVYMELFGNTIARRDSSGLYICTCGWKTKTTKERLNELPGVDIRQKNSKFYLNGEEWDGNWIKIK